ncbi:MAG: TetR/AcrR family transcriptional regulator [Sphingobacteriales bacterium]|nr:TetR/AcrR family transcriptional regulator [Sphingobacteriales bacterium]
MKDVKNEILKVCLKYFLQHGVRKMTNDNLVAQLGISTKTLYKYFKDKEHLIEECLRLYYSQQFALFEKSEKGGNAAIFLFDVWYHGIEEECKVNKLFFTDLNYYYADIEEKIEKEVVKKVWLRFKQIVQQGIDDGFFKKDINADIFLEALSAIYVAIARTNKFKKFRKPVDIIFINSIALLIRGICTTESVADFDNYVAEVFPAIHLN